MLDDDEKIRRNLVLVSTAVIIYWWLDLPPGAITEKILGQGVASNVDPWKVWLSLIAVLSYLGYRFYFVSKPLVDVQKARDERERDLYNYLLRVSKEDIEKFHLSNGSENSRLRESDIEAGGASSTNKFVKAGSKTPFDLRYSQFTCHRETVDWPPRIYVKFTITSNLAYQGSKVFEFKLTLMQSIKFELTALCKLTKFKAMPEIVMPVVLAYFAMVLSCRGLVNALML